MARHSAPKNPTARRALLAVTTAGVALGAGAGTAAAAGAQAVDVMGGRNLSPGNVNPQAGLRAVTGTVGYTTGPVAGLKPNPLAGTGVDPLDNGVATQMADFKPLASRSLTGPVAQASSVGSMPVVGQAVRGRQG
ncbi:hypothetical protein SGFS_046890 [Streptomyces graminofaciens]|uniref:ATP-binding protein n=1 Tax=Streptomyces graminofaciens TaxID=68212 RepID=A0ABM7FBH5_9ACTN|nr:hypothetical protein [Streptomyces graminofaciens]BBC33395.1 hypothetical protein SGFS_046890 [Streptomyces graminofaciens]